MKQKVMVFVLSLLLLFGSQSAAQAAEKVYPGGQPIGIYVQSGHYDVLANGEKVFKNCHGIGTLTYTTEDDYVALGHGIYDEKGQLFSLSRGDVYQSSLLSIIKGKKGTPGELVGSMEESPSLYMGSIMGNTVHGIYGELRGTFQQNQKKESAVPLAESYAEVHRGAAVIRSWISGVPKDYHIQILKTDTEMQNKEKGMVIRITDQELLKETGGIVQGMSGTPILQDGRLVGAVTHVFVQDPTKGYAVYAMDLAK